MRTVVVLCLTMALLVAGCVGGDDSDPDNAPSDLPPEGGNLGAGNGTSNNATDDNTTLPPPPAEPLDWGEPAEKTLRPGIRFETLADTCTSSFLLTHSWERYFLATAAHCVDTGSGELDGCQAGTLPLGTGITMHATDGAERTGTLAYSSWITMQDVGETDPDACLGNDFALVEVAPDDWGHLHPAVLHFGGPTQIRQGGSTSGEPVVAYGASPLRDEAPQSRPRQGTSLGMTSGGWAHQVYLATPAVPGDSGGPLMDQTGAALGVASTLETTDVPGSNTYTDASKAIAYANQHTDLDVELVPWDAFDASVS